MRAFVTCDGEQEQHGDLLDIFSDDLIDFGKIAASCSGIHQSSDVSPLFRVVKTKIHAVETRRYGIYRVDFCLDCSEEWRDIR